MTSVRASSYSDIGKVRKENEDRFLFDLPTLTFGVADGVGGLPGGGEAAQEVSDQVLRQVRAAAPDQELDLRQIVWNANEAVVALGVRMAPGLGIGSTLCWGCIRDSKFKLAHVGDSRAFMWRNDDFMMLTEDHSVENEARRRRARGEVVYYSEAQRGALTRCIGQTLPPEVDLADLPLQAGDRFLFATDGVTRMVTERELKEVVAAASTPEEIVRMVVKMAVDRGGPDNATSVAFIVDQP